MQEDNFGLQRGDVVTFSYINYTSSFVPFRPKITRVRYDFAWDDILHDYHRPSQRDPSSSQKREMPEIGILVY